MWGVNSSNLFRATIIQHQSSKVGHGNMGSVALPGVLRAGGDGQQFTTGSMQKAQFSHMLPQAYSGHAPPSAVSSIPTHASYLVTLKSMQSRRNFQKNERSE